MPSKDSTTYWGDDPKKMARQKKLQTMQTTNNHEMQMRNA